ncbi:MAG TPA: cupin domain-containing protein [Candidatus Binataceae bacterium]|nr:cupin domain-containing protein [Candidatus Binataceae bacterium]
MSRSQLIEVNQREWQPMRPGILMKPLWSDEASRRRVQITRFEPGASLPMHRHDGDELLYVIEGALSDEAGTVTAGNIGFRPNGCTHSVKSTHGATVLAFISGSIEAATEVGSAPSSQIITLTEIPWKSAMTGVQQKPVWEDKASKRRAVLVRFEPGAKLPAHRHVGDEFVFVIEGSNADEAGELHVGNLNYRPNGCEHSVWTKHGATALALVTGTVEML